ncbi:unnamed protein product, partial [Allacma fusca]
FNTTHPIMLGYYLLLDFSAIALTTENTISLGSASKGIFDIHVLYQIGFNSKMNGIADQCGTCFIFMNLEHFSYIIRLGIFC